MSTTYRLLGICGSLRAGAYSKAVLEFIAEVAAPKAQLDYAEIGALPHFNQDLCTQPLPADVRHFCAQVVAAHALVISSPEFNHGMPGVLKNALEWASRPHNASPLKHKPVLIVTSSPAFTGGVRAQYQIRETVVSALARPVATPEIVIGGVGAKMQDGRFTDSATFEFAKLGLGRMFEEIDMLAMQSWR
jgi:chromate reductase, NAD(P)H dehydrogenase (quinone)